MLSSAEKYYLKHCEQPTEKYKAIYLQAMNIIQSKKIKRKKKQPEKSGCRSILKDSAIVFYYKKFIS